MILSHQSLSIMFLQALAISISSPHVLTPMSSCSYHQWVPSKQSKVLFVDFPYYNQHMITHVLKNYPRLRDLFRMPGVNDKLILFSPPIIFANIVAATFNATLISTTGLVGNCLAENKTASKISLYRETRGVVLNSVSKAQGTPRETWFPMIEKARSFGYCQTRRHQANLSPLKIFESSADILVWICLGMSILAISLLVKADYSQELSLIILTTLSRFLCPGFSGVQISSKLFLLWTFFCLIFVTYYSGHLTSVVTSPLPEERLRNIEELWKANYSLIFSTPRELSTTNETVYEDINWIEKHNNGQRRRKLNIIKKLLRFADAYSTFTFSWYERLKNAENVAFFGYFQIVMHHANLVTDLLRKENISGIRCFVGEELEFRHLSFFVVTSSDRDRLIRILEALMETGFQTRWLKDSIQLFQFNRVQDRSRSISMTKLAEEVNPVKSLWITDGKLKNVFFLWGLFLVISLVVFALENLKIYYPAINLGQRFGCLESLHQTQILQINVCSRA